MCPTFGLYGQPPLRATRPLHFFRADGPMPDALDLPLTIPAELGRPPRWSRSCATAYAPSSLSVRSSERARGVACWVGARCARSHGAITGEPGAPAEPAAPGGDAKQVGASGRESRRCCAIARSPRSTLARASNGETAFLSCSYLAPTGSTDSRRSQYSRPDLVISSGTLNTTKNITVHDMPPPASSGAGGWPCLGSTQRPAMHSSTAIAEPLLPSACKPRHRSNVSSADVPAPRALVYAFLAINVVRVFFAHHEPCSRSSLSMKGGISAQHRVLYCLTVAPRARVPEVIVQVGPASSYRKSASFGSGVSCSNSVFGIASRGRRPPISC